uniref:Uncharacterized protein n=1 Tax=Anguilla anguilla TaxID=7936 RepID=A0A0E9U430_ANGAN
MTADHSKMFFKKETIS